MIKCETTKYPDGVGYCLYRTIGEDNDDCGLCFDMEESEVDDAVLTLVNARNRIPDHIYEPDLEWEKFKKKQAILEAKWWYKCWEFLEDISIQIHPFDWKLKTYIITRRTDAELYKWCDGFSLGCITFTWGEYNK